MRYYSSSSDFYYDTTKSTLNYYITVNGETIYNGKAVKSPSKDVISIDVGKRVRDYIRINMPDFSDYDGVVVPHPEAMLVFNLYDSQSGSILEQYNVRIDDTKEWSGEEGCLSEPINTHADPRQKIFYGYGSEGSQNIDIEVVDENTPRIIFERPFYFGWESGTTTICYTANTDFTLSSYEGGWYTVTQAKADEYTGCLTFNYNQNNGDRRDGTLCMETESGYVKCFPVIQRQYVGGYCGQYLTFVILSGGTIELSGPGSPKSFYYSKDGGNTWDKVPEGFTVSIDVNTGERVMFKSGELLGFVNTIFAGSAYFNLEGNIQSLIYGDDFDGIYTAGERDFEGVFAHSNVVSAENLCLNATELDDMCYAEMFENCTSLVVAPELPATKMAHMCYAQMFKGCTSLVTAPELPAETLALSCYLGMFQGCSSLRNLPELPATTLRGDCYAQMFEDCTSLTATPELPATVLTVQCYSRMFAGCTSLTVPPELPATTLSRHCYSYMFWGCTGLTTAPELPAATLSPNCYRGMFAGCTSLTVAPDLLALKLSSGCYKEMFYGCTSLSYVKCLATEAAGWAVGVNDTYQWMTNVAWTGVFCRNTAATELWPRGENGIPTEWTVQTASS